MDRGKETVLMSKKKLVYVLSIDHKYGTNIYVNMTDEGSRAELLKYVLENWESTMPKEHLLRTENAVEDYFSTTEEEFYEIEFCEIGD